MAQLQPSLHFHIKSGTALAQEQQLLALMQKVRDVGAAAVLTLATPDVPVYKKPWFWGVVAVAVASVVGVSFYARR